MALSERRERRTVTVLFADLSGFTRLSEDRDPEEVGDLVDEMFRRLRVVIEAQGGTIDKFIGDAVMAVFGAPTGHPDDPLRAVRAAMAMHKELAKFAGERQIELAMRIGLNTGEVLWGGVGGDRPTAMGDAVNLAQRLESATAPGSILVSRSTESATSAQISYKAGVPLTIKGRDGIVETFEALGEKVT